jgi:U4/U6.U5 tri-snRNP-associated protein 1
MKESWQGADAVMPSLSGPLLVHSWHTLAGIRAPEELAGALEAAAIGTADESWNFDFKLDRFDEFGRKMTPKEAFRELCHKFHGIFPSRSKQEARLKQWHEEQTALKVASGDTPLDAAAKMRDTQLRTATPFVVLSGRVSSAQVTDAASRYAQSEREAEAAPAPLRSALLGGGRAPPPPLSTGPLGGGALPPLEGVEKVRFMLGPGAPTGAKRPGGEAERGGAKHPRS